MGALPTSLNPLGVGGVRNPYVTDGLIVMFDGEWNAGIGKHNASATTWANLVGTEKPSLLSTMSWGSDCLNIPSSGTGVSISLSTATVRHIEIVCRSDSTVSTAFAVAGHENSSFVFYQSGKALVSNAKKSVLGTFMKGATFSLSVAYDGTTATDAWLDGIAATLNADSTSISSGSFSTSALRIGGRSAGTLGFMGCIYCIRVYTRALTAAEVASNYSVDQRRFGV